LVLELEKNTLLLHQEINFEIFNLNEEAEL
jgi:hypothetical protein